MEEHLQEDRLLAWAMPSVTPCGRNFWRLLQSGRFANQGAVCEYPSLLLSCMPCYRPGSVWDVTLLDGCERRQEGTGVHSQDLFEMSKRGYRNPHGLPQIHCIQAAIALSINYYLMPDRAPPRWAL